MILLNEKKKEGKVAMSVINYMVIEIEVKFHQ